MRRTSYQKGSLKLADRKNGKAWEYRWREVQRDGSIRRKNIVIGTLEDYPNESAAQAAVDAIRLEINQQTPQQLLKSITLETLVKHYRQHELPDVFNKTKPQPISGRGNQIVCYAGDIRGLFTQVDSSSLGRLPAHRYQGNDCRKLVKSAVLPQKQYSVGKGEQGQRRIMSALYSHAIRWEWAEKNPITSVRQSAKRQRGISDPRTGRDHGYSLKNCQIHSTR